MIALGVLVLMTVVDCVPSYDLYHHQFAVHVPEGPHYATELAHRHGFVNHGQVSSQDNKFT